MGRLDELEVLDHALSQALGGAPRIVLIGGEAGVGKTRLADELLGRAVRAGATVLSGSCHEDLSVPYLPVAGALRPLAAGGVDPVDRAAIARLLDPGAAASSTSDPADADRDRLALYLAVDRVLLTAARTRPVVLAIDDLHWADDASLDLLAHLLTTVSHEAAFDGLPLLVIATHRPVDRNTRVARSIDRFQREPGALRVALGGLGELEINELVASLAPARPTRRLLHEIVEATDGNPLLVEGVVGALLREGAHVEGGELLPGPTGVTAGGASLLDVDIRARLDQLSGASREMLTIAAFLGDGGSVGELTAVLGQDAEELGRLLDEAAGAQLFDDDGLTFRFAHPQVRQLLYHEPRPRPRAGLHLRIADALEALYGAEAESHALSIAHHLARAGGDPDPDRLLRWNLLAGDQAWGVAAWAQAGRCYGVAVAALGDPGPERWEEVADLHLRAGWADFHNFDLASAMAHLQIVVDLAKRNGDLARWGEALQPLIRFQLGHGDLSTDVLVNAGEEFLAAVGDGHPSLRALTLALLAEAEYGRRQPDAAGVYIARAQAALEQVDDPSVASLVVFSSGLVAMAVLDLGRARALFVDSDREAIRSDDVWRQRTALGRLPVVSFVSGQVLRAVAEVAEGRAHNGRWNLRGELTLTTALQAGLAVAQSRFADAERAGTEAALLFRRTGYVFAPPLSQVALAAGRAFRGDVAGAHEALDVLEEVNPRGVWRYRQLIACWSGDIDGIRDAIAERPWPAPPERSSGFALDGLALHVEVAAAIGDVAMAETVRPALDRAWVAGAVWTNGWPALIPRLLGVVHGMAGRIGDAEEWFARARNHAAAAEAPGEAARVDLDHATALSAQPAPDRGLVRELLDRAAAEFDRLGMLPFLVTARRLGGRGADGGTAGQTRVILYTDLVDSTELNVRAGDADYMVVLREHNRIVRERLRTFDGVEFKHTGDGICAWFTSASQAVECAIEIRDDLDRYSALHPEMPLSVRIGLAAGEPVDEDGDLFGLTVVAAGRICAAAGAGRVLVAEEIPRLVSGSSLRFTDIGEVSLKGFPEPFRLHEAMADR